MALYILPFSVKHAECFKSVRLATNGKSHATVYLRRDFDRSRFGLVQFGSEP